MKSKLLYTLIPLLIVVFSVQGVAIYQNAYKKALIDPEQEAHNIGGVLMATRRVYHNQFINSGVPVNDATIGFLPAHAMGWIPRDFENWSDSGLTFNNVSYQARNLQNAADEIEDTSNPKSIHGDETIPVVDDDDGVRELSTRILRKVGYTVLTAIDGEDAIRVFSENKDDIDMIVLDVVMPKLGGKAAFDAIRKDAPDVRILFSSGYSMSSIHTNYVLDEGMQFIRKPFHLDQFQAKIRGILDS